MNSEDMRRAARLATDAAQGLADLVEAMHEMRTPGITGLPNSSHHHRTP